MDNRMLKDLLCDQVAQVDKALVIDRVGLCPVDTPTHPGLVERKAP